MNQKYVTTISSNKRFFQTEQKEKISPFETNINQRAVLTGQNLDSCQQLFDFISNKKFSLKTVFDHRGAKAFLNGKDKAMERIELNESIEENKIKTKKEKKNKKIKHRKSQCLLDKKKHKEIIIKEKYNKKRKISQKQKSKSTKCLLAENKLTAIKDKFKYFELEALLWEPSSPKKRHKEKKPIIEVKIKSNKDVNKYNFDKLMNLNDSKLYINKDNSNCNIFSSRENDSVLQTLIYELDVNKN